MPSLPTFVYGTLRAPEVLHALLGRAPTSRPALLSGYSRFSVCDACFPAVLPGAPDDTVDGLLLDGLSQREERALDYFEDEEYTRQPVSVSIEGGARRLEAQAYIWELRFEHLLDRETPWSFDEFRSRDLSWYLSDVCEPCRAEFDAAEKAGTLPSE